MTHFRGGAARHVRAASAGLGMLVLAGCSSMPGFMPPGTSIEQARHTLFGPTEEFALPGGGTRLEFPRGNETYMLDFDPQGALVTSQQVLTLANLGDVTPGMPAGEVRMRYGRPVTVYGVAFPRDHVWNYRFAQADCVWYQISIDDASQTVSSAGLGPDPLCNGPSRGEH